MSFWKNSNNLIIDDKWVFFVISFCLWLSIYCSFCNKSIIIIVVNNCLTESFCCSPYYIDFYQYLWMINTYVSKEYIDSQCSVTAVFIILFSYNLMKTPFQFIFLINMCYLFFYDEALIIYLQFLQIREKSVRLW